jgi:hypothetical protein
LLCIVHVTPALACGVQDVAAWQIGEPGYRRSIFENDLTPWCDSPHA